MVKMPSETNDAIHWVVTNNDSEHINPNLIVDGVREYFTEHGVVCEPMSYLDLKPYLEIYLKEKQLELPNKWL